MQFLLIHNVGYIQIIYIFKSGRIGLVDGSIIIPTKDMVVMPKEFRPERKYILKSKDKFIQRHIHNLEYIAKTLGYKESKPYLYFRKFKRLALYVLFLSFISGLVAYQSKVNVFYFVSGFLVVSFIFLFWLSYGRKN